MNVFKRLFVGMAIVALFLSIINIPIYFSQKAYALTATNFVFDPGDVNSTNDLRRANAAFDNDGNDYDEGENWSLFKIYTRDFPDLKSFQIPYSESDSSQFNSGGGNSSTARQPVFSFTYYCSVPSNKLDTKRPTNDPKVVYEIRYGIILQNNEREANLFMNQANFNGTAGILKVIKTDASPTPKETWNVFGPDDPKRIANGNESAFKENGAKGAFGIDDAGCQPPASIIGSFGGSGGLKNFRQLDETTSLLFREAVDSGTINSAQQPDDNIDSLCQKSPGTFSGGIAFIVCPLINIGVQATDTLFTQLIQPLMEDVPVSTKTDTGTYRAWQSFRTIGNIVLIGTLLAVVYAQVKGDR